MGEKIHAPTPRKLKKARQKGQVAVSQELASAALFMGALLFIWALHDLFFHRFREVLTKGLLEMGREEPLRAIREVGTPLLAPTLWILLALFFLAMGIPLLQRGWIWAPDAIKPKWRRKRSQRRWIFPLLKGGIIGGISYVYLRSETPSTTLLSHGPTQQVGALFHKIFILSFEIALALLLLGILDLMYQKWRFRKEMRMTHEEYLEEKRETEIKRRL